MSAHTDILRTAGHVRIQFVRVLTALACTALLAGAASDVSIRRSNGAPAHNNIPTGRPSASRTRGAGLVVTTTDPPVDAGAANPGTSWDRSQCFAVSGGPGVAYECGDLRLARGLPTVRTFGEVRGMSMLYGSRFAAAMPILAARVTLPGGLGTPTRVTADLRVGAIGAAKVSRATGEWTGADFTAAVPRRIALTYEAASDPSGTYAYDIVVTFWNGAVSTGTYTNEGRFVLVNRSASPYGRGWWPSGIEQLIHLSNGDKAWIGADGSTRHYALAGPNLWRADALDRPDSLTFNGTHWIRWAEHRTQVKFDAVGQHVATVSRLGRTTTFAYGSVPFRLDSVSVPGLATPLYRFDFSTAYVMNVLTPAPNGGTPRTTRVESNVDGVTRICDPDGVCTSYVYAFAGGERHLVSAFDRRGTREDFDYSFAHVLRAMIRDAAGIASARTFGTVGEARGLMVPGGVAPSTLANDHFTTASGPRGVGDYEAAYLNRFSAPVRIGESGYYYDEIQYNDPRFPALATAVIKQNRFTTLATYDARGNLDTVTAVNPHDDLRNAVTRYTWDGTWDEVTRIVSPEGDSTNIGIDPTTGVRLWQQDGRGDSTRVNFSYTGGQLDYIQSAGASLGQRTHLTYDALGNLQTEQSPLTALTTVHGDALGRADTVYTRIDATHTHVHSVDYDLMGRVSRESLFGPSITAGSDLSGAPFTVPATSVTTTNYYSTGGDLDSTIRSPSGGTVRALTTGYRYDALGRVRVVVSADGTKDSTAYDPAGNVITQVTRNGDTLRSTYDPLNRMLTRVIPAKTLSSHDAKICERGYCPSYPDPYPHFDLSGAGPLTFPSDTATFVYDPVSGLLTTANNANSNVTRTYYANGALKTEAQHVRTLSTGAIVQGVHDYALAYRYDLSGRRLGLSVPDPLRPRNSADSALASEIRYGYRTDNGALSTITDLLGHVSTAEYNARGERWRTSLPGAVVTDTLDIEGRLISNSALWNEAGTPQRRADAMTYDAQGKLVSMVATAGPATTMRSWYSGLGQLAHSQSESRQGLLRDQLFKSKEFFALTGLGDITSEQTTSTYRFNQYGGFLTYGDTTETTTRKLRVYNPVNGQLQWQYDPVRVDTMEYDPAGNTVFSRGLSTADRTNVMEERASFYDASGRLRVTETRQYTSISQFARVFEESFEDALGRRVLVRTRRFCPHPTDVFDKYCALSTVRRTIWDGSAELGEIQQPATAADMENDGALTAQQDAGAGAAYNPNPFFGTVVYVYGLYGPDRPVSILRLHYVDWTALSAPVRFDTLTVTPLWNALGQMDVGVFPNGSRRDSVGTTHVKLDFPSAWFPYYRERYLAQSWFGTLLQDKADGSGLLYRRNRYYDPSTGRFTQEDPIGLAGGMNLYGFAGGDPVNFSDPFGLCPDPNDPACTKEGNIGTFSFSTAGAAGNKGLNASVGLAMNSFGDFMLFQTSGTSVGLGAAAGFQGGVQRGTLNDLVARTGEGGGLTASGTVTGLGGSVKFDDARRLTGGALGAGGPLAFTADRTSVGHGSATYNPMTAAKKAFDDALAPAREFGAQATRFMTCPNGCKP